MPKKPSPSVDPVTSLRERAEVSVRASRTDIARMSLEEVQRTVHELQVHQIELEMQNEDLRSAEVELAQSRDRFHQLYDFAPVGYMTYKPDGTVLEANLTLATMLGVERGNLVGRPFTRFVLPGSQDTLYLHERSAHECPAKHACDLWLLRKGDGKSFAARLETIGIREEVAGTWLYLSAISDITERKEAEAALKASLHEQEVLLSEVHHRVKNNLQIVSSLLNLQSRQLAGPAQMDVFASTRDRVWAMAAVHEQLYEGGDFGAIDLAVHLERLVRMLLRAHGATVEPVLRFESMLVDLKRAVPLSLIANELIVNAFKYAFAGRPNGTFTLELGTNGTNRELRITDDGPGLPSNLDLATTTTLGLRLARDLARQIRGEIAVESPEAGTSIVIRWPF